MKKILQRLVEYIEYKRISLHAFDVSIGASNGYIGKQIKNNGSIGSDVIEKIHQVYSELNLNWLLTGDGEMIYENFDPNYTPILKESSQEYNNCFDKKVEIKLLNEALQDLKTQLTELNKDKESYRKQLEDCSKDKELFRKMVENITKQNP